MRLLSALVALLAQLDSVLGFGYTQSNGKTRLVGASFGVPHFNRTFDYVVRLDFIL